MFGIWHIYLGPIGINLSVIFLALFVLALATIEKLRLRKTCFFEVSYLLILVGFLYFTLHGRILQLIFPISLPEKPLVDNNLTFNYTLTSLLTFIIFPILLLKILKSDVSLSRFGLKVSNFKQTILYASFGTVFAVLLFWVSNRFLGFEWVSGYTVDGLLLWVLLVNIISVFAQTFFFVGILFNSYSRNENTLLVGIISISALQFFVSTSFLWIVINVIGSVAKILVTWKSHNIYGATLMSITTNMLDILLQII